MTTIGARTLQGTCPGGPNIRAVIRRRTIRLSDNALIDDIDLSVPTRKSVLFKRISGPIDIRTDFYYLPGKCGQYNSELAKAVRVKPAAKGLSFNDNAEILQVENIRTRDEPRPIMNRRSHSHPIHPDRLRQPPEVIAMSEENARILAATTRQIVQLQLGEYVPDNRWARRPRMIRENVPDQMPAMPGPQIEIRWLADTGCPFDLVGMHDIPAQDRRHIKNGRTQHSLQTANGVAGTQGRVDATVESLDEDIEAFVMGNTPSIVSIGRRCADFGYSFRWDAFETPVLICPSGRTVRLDVINNVPYLPKGPVMFMSCDTGNARSSNCHERFIVPCSSL